MDSLNDIADRIAGAPEVVAADYDGGRDQAESGGGGDDSPPDDNAQLLENIKRCATLDQNDTCNGQRLIMHLGDDWLHVRGVGHHGWCGTHWDLEGGEEFIKRKAQEVGPLIKQEARFIDFRDDEAEIIKLAEKAEKKQESKRTAKDKNDIALADDARDRVAKLQSSRWKFGISCGNEARTKSMINQAVVHKTFAIEEMDVDPLLFNVANGTLKFTKKQVNDDEKAPVFEAGIEIVPHDRVHRISKLSPASYDPEATCPLFDAALHKFQPNADTRLYLQVYFGYCMLGHAGEQVFLYNYGSGANFKSTMVETMARLFGGYARSVPPESLTGQGQRRGDQASPDIARLADVRFVYVEELPRGEPIKENLVKALTGGGKVTARHLHGDFFEFEPIFKAVMTGNDMPNITGADHGIWRRIKIIPWNVRIADEERRPMATILDEFSLEGAGILNWLIDGALLYLENGLQFYEPDDVKEFTKDYQVDMDPLGRFIKSCTLHSIGSQVGAREMYKAYVRFCEANSIRPWKETAFGKTMPQRGFKKSKSNYVFYEDVMLVPLPVDMDDDIDHV